MLASTYGIRNLKRIEPNLMVWMKKPDENYDRAADAYKELVLEYQRFMGHVLKNIGGMYETPKTIEQSGPEFELEDKGKQKRAMVFLQEQLFTTPTWLIDDKLYSVSRADFSEVVKIQIEVVQALLSGKMLNELLEEEDNFPGKAYTATEMLHDLHQGIFSELAANKPVSVYRRNLQKAYVEDIIALLGPKMANTENDALSIVKSHARMLEAELKKAAALYPEGITRDHFVDLAERLERALKPGDHS